MTSEKNVTEMSEAEILAPIPVLQNPLSAEQEKEEMEKILREEDIPSYTVSGAWCIFVPSQWWKEWITYTHFKDFLMSYSDSFIACGSRPGVIDMDLITKKSEDGVVVLAREQTKHCVPLPYVAWRMIASWYGVRGFVYCTRILIDSSDSRTLPMFNKRMQFRVYVNGKKDSDPISITPWASQTVGSLKEEICKKLNLIPGEYSLYDYYDRQRGGVLKEGKALSESDLFDNQDILLVKNGDKLYEKEPSREKNFRPYGYNERDFGRGKRSKHSNMDDYGFGYSERHNPYRDDGWGRSHEYDWSSSYSSAVVPKMEKPGVCGLHNLGNTCFMNSALQCLSHTEALRNYLLSGKWESEINEQNALGTHGKLTRSYADVMRRIWKGTDSYFSPAEFKQRISEFAPQFSGYKQHDSQELLMFLLDGIHEDLNRVKQKPYVENPDYAGQPDEEWAAESWKLYKMRNDSVIVDWLHGQMKQKLICPVCQNECVVFDPFTFLSVPLPEDNMIRMTVNVHTNDMSKQHFSVTIDMKKSSTVLDLCRSIEGLPCFSGVNPAIKWDQICVRSNRSYGNPHNLPVNNHTREWISSLKGKEMHMFHLTGIKGSRDVFTVVAKKNGTTDEIIGQPFLLPLLKDMTYFDVCLRVFERIASGVNIDALKSFIEPIVARRTEEHQNVENPPEFFPPDDRDWGTKIFPGIPNRDLLIAVDSVFSLSVIDEYGRLAQTLAKKNGLVPTFASMGTVFYVKILLTQEASEAQIYDERILLQNTISFAQCVSDTGVVNGRISLDKCLDLFTSPETLGDKDLWMCHKCHVLRNASRQTFFWKVPPLLLVHLKRFGNGSGLFRDKIDLLVDFPVKGLDMTKRVLFNPTGEPLIYDLYAVSNHFGSLGGGHYTAYALVDDEWYNFDDSRVSKVSDPESVKTPAAYVLFYKLRNWDVPQFK